MKQPRGPTAHQWAARQRDHPEKGAGEDDIGQIIKVNGNWTVDVKWTTSPSFTVILCVGEVKEVQEGVHRRPLNP